MRGASGQSLDALRERQDTLLRSGTTAASGLGDDLLAVTRLLDAQPALRRALTEVGRDASDRAGLVERVLGGQVSPEAVDLVAGAVRDRWASPADLAAALGELGLDAHLAAAQQEGRLDAVEDELFRFTRVVEGTPELRSALVDRAAPADSRRQLVHELLDGRAAPETVRLVEHAVIERRDRSLDVALERLSTLAARRREHVVATVTVAAPLTEAHRDRLARVLGARRGTPVDLDVVVDPDVLGGIRVEIGDEVIDGTISSRLDDARRRMAG